MTKERQLAIEMWQAMREKVSKGEINSGAELRLAKHSWLKEHHIDWYCSCWFCHYFRKDDEYEDDTVEDKTAECPLNPRYPFRCDGQCPQYSIACNPKYPMEQRLAAVDNIIKALKGEYEE